MTGTLRRTATVLLAVGTGALLATWLTLVVDNLSLLDGASVREVAGYAWDAAWPWVLRVTLWCAVLWIATVEQARRGRTWLPLVGAGIVVACWTAVGSFGIWTMSYEGPVRPPLVDQLGSAVGWPGPEGSDWLQRCFVGGCSTHVRPAIVTPVLLAAALVVTATLAARSVTARERSSSTARSRTVAGAVLGGSALVSLAAAAWLGVPDSFVGGDALLEVADAMTPVLLAAWVGLTTVGAGRIGWAAFAGSLVGWTWTWLETWWEYQEDGMLARGLLGTAAAVLVALVVPASRAMGRLDRDAPPVPSAPAAVVER
ncbi:MAG TPA: hypothetical protein VNR62_08705 [Cellulomonas sp.]|nr:hypothetical protein [Cellulomonas sp.]